jgi:hypothetical protein
VRRRRPLVRDFHAGEFLDLFLVSAVSAILGIRFYLELTGYPQVGGETLHVAHMLWGGLLMLAAIVLLLSYLGKAVARIGALLGGVGFGTFIDEVGKFVTRDHDYFYRPAVALIYITFVGTYLAIRSIHSRRRPSAEEYLVNALHEMEDVAFGDLDSQERDRALRYLDRSDPADPLVAALRDALHRAEVVPTPSPHPLVRLRAGAVRHYRRLAAHPRFHRTMVVFFALQLVFKVADAVLLWVGVRWKITVPLAFPLTHDSGQGLSLAAWAELASSLLSGCLILAGLLLLRRSRPRALGMFRGSVLVSIFLTQVFMFYRHQWTALVVLAFYLLVLAALNFVIEHEGHRGAPLRT